MLINYYEVLISCIYAVFYRNCEFIKKQTNVLGETTLLQFGGTIDGQPNPLEIDLGINDFKVLCVIVILSEYATIMLPFQHGVNLSFTAHFK